MTDLRGMAIHRGCKVSRGTKEVHRGCKKVHRGNKNVHRGNFCFSSNTEPDPVEDATEQTTEAESAENSGEDIELVY
jgi:hypothetical protein